MAEHSLILRYKLDESDRDVDAVVERLGAAGCTDAIVGIAYEGVISLDFTREAPSAEEAGRTALADVEKALPWATLIGAEGLAYDPNGTWAEDMVSDWDSKTPEERAEEDARLAETMRKNGISERHIEMLLGNKPD